MGSSWQDKETFMAAGQRNCNNELPFQENRSQQQLFWELMSYTHLCTYTKKIQQVSHYLPKESFSAHFSSACPAQDLPDRTDPCWGCLTNSALHDRDHL